MALPTAQWFFAKEGEQVGPIPETELVSLLSSRDLPPDTLVWKEGMDGWLAAGEIGALSARTTPQSADPTTPIAQDAANPSPYAPPTVSSEVPVAPVAVSGTQVRPWVRFWARTVDILIIGFTTGILLGWLAPGLLVIPEILLNVVILGFAVVIQAAFFALVGTTPGKAIFRVSVRQADGSKLDFPTAIAREARVFVFGLGLGIPLVALITQIAAYSKLNSEGITPWDRAANLEVSHQTVGVWRILLVVAIFFGFVTLVTYGTTA